MKLAPSRWSGQARQLIQEVLKPFFPKKERVQIWHELILRRMNETDPLFRLGNTKSDLRSRWGQEQIHKTLNGDRVVFGDLSTATAIQTFLIDAPVFNVEKAAALLLQLPHHNFDLDKFTRWSGLTNNVSSAGWLTAHLFSPWETNEDWESVTSEDLRRRCFRHLHPLNSFLFPNLNKSGSVFAQDPRFLALMCETYSQHYGELWSAYLSLTQDDVAKFPTAEDFSIDLASQIDLPVAVKSASKELISKIDPKEAFDLKLVTISESQGSHSRLIEPSQMTRGFLDIKLEFKEKGGEIRTLGFFRLNLKELFEKKLIVHDAKGLKLALYKINESFVIAPKKTASSFPFPLS